MAAKSTLLSVAPFLATTSSLTLTVCEDLFIRSLIPKPSEPELRVHANRVLPIQGRFIKPGAPFLASIYGLNIVTGVMNFGRSHGSEKLFYAAGLCFTLLHFVWGQRALHLLSTVRNDQNIDGDENKDNVAAITEWVRLNAIRGVCADFPAWLCYFRAFLLSMP